MDILDDLKEMGVHTDDTEIKSGLPMNSEINFEIANPEVLEVEDLSEPEDIKLKKSIDTALDKLGEKYSVPIKSQEVKETLQNIDKYTADDDYHKDLAYSKLITTVGKEQLARNVFTLLQLTNVISDSLLRQTTSVSKFDIDSMSALRDLFNYQKELKGMIKEYEKLGIDESLEQLKNKEEKVKAEKLSYQDYQNLIKKVKELHHDGS